MAQFKRKWLLVGIVLSALVVASAAPAEAGWWWGHRSALWGCGTCYNTCFGGWDSCCGCCVPAWDYCCASSWGWGWGGCGSCGGYGYAGSYGIGYGVVGYPSLGCCGDGVVSAAPATIAPAPSGPAQSPTPAPPELPPAPASPATGTPNLPAPTTSVEKPDSGVLAITVPEDARVTINGMATKSTGAERQYVSYGLKPGYAYNYEVKVEVVRDGQTLSDVRTIRLAAGDRELVGFALSNMKPVNAIASR